MILRYLVILNSAGPRLGLAESLHSELNSARCQERAINVSMGNEKWKYAGQCLGELARAVVGPYPPSILGMKKISQPGRTGWE